MSSTQQLLLGEGAGGGPANYIEEVFSTTLYVGDGATGASYQQITNNIDLSTKGGLVWLKNRTANSSYTESHGLFDTVRGAYYGLNSNGTAASTNYADMGVSAFNTDGFDTKNRADPGAGWNNRNIAYTSWTFRKQPKFFDVVTYTGNGVAGRTVAHNLGSVPGCMIVKRTDTTSNWRVYHRGLTSAAYDILLNQTLEEGSRPTIWNSTAPTSTVFSVGTDSGVNANGGTYVAYLFAHDAGGFGLTGTDNVISCGSYTGNGSATGPVVTLGYEPQWVMIKGVTVDGAFDWTISDNMRGIPMVGNTPMLFPNTSGQESAYQAHGLELNSTGFQITNTFGATNANGATYIYIAIRRGPMKVPTLGTTVFGPTTTANGTQTSGVPVKDAVLNFTLTSTAGWQMVDRLRGILAGFTANVVGNTTTNPYLITNSAAVESSTGCRIGGFGIAGNIATAGTWSNGDTVVIASGDFATAYFFRRAPSFFDVVCYTGNDVAGRNITHNLTVAPELMIVKNRSVTFGGGRNWNVYAAPLNNVNAGLFLDLTNPASGSGGVWNGTVPTSSVFTVSANPDANYSGWTYVAYLFATCPGVSKVGGYTGNATLTTIDCGFTSGARWVMIRRTDDYASWYVWDSARGMVSGTDPSLQVNFTSGNASGNSVFTVSTGFQVVASPAVDVNTNGGTYIFLAIA